MKEFYVYILSSKKNGTLYVGATSELARRVWEHRNKVVPSFTSKYNVTQLVYYEAHATVFEALIRERRFKNWPRSWKLNLISRFNPTWRDLFDEISV